MNEAVIAQIIDMYESCYSAAVQVVIKRQYWRQFEQICEASPVRREASEFFYFCRFCYYESQAVALRNLCGRSEDAEKDHNLTSLLTLVIKNRREFTYEWFEEQIARFESSKADRIASERWKDLCQEECDSLPERVPAADRQVMHTMLDPVRKYVSLRIAHFRPSAEADPPPMSQLDQLIDKVTFLVEKYGAFLLQEGRDIRVIYQQFDWRIAFEYPWILSDKRHSGLCMPIWPSDPRRWRWRPFYWRSLERAARENGGEGYGWEWL
ncbi:MAG: hypothetical protein ACF8SC_01420 [Phycisphaerales bacterium JB037]